MKSEIQLELADSQKDFAKSNHTQWSSVFPGLNFPLFHENLWIITIQITTDIRDIRKKNYLDMGD